MNLKPRRIGMFRVTDEVLLTIGWEKLGQILGKTGMLIVRAEFQLDTRAIQYVAFCSLFDEILEGIAVPEYRGEIEHKGHTLGIYFRRVS